MRVLKSLAALLVLVALLAGVPALLLSWGDPLALLDVQWRTALLRPDDGTILLGILGVAGWLAWVVVACTTVLEVLSQLSRQRRRIRLPGVSWLQPALGALVATALLPMLSANAEEPTPPVASHTTLQDKEPELGPTRKPQAQARGVREYVVEPGDELWGVAERELGSGPAWRSIVSCNAGLTADTSLVAGTTILLPENPPSVQSGTPVEQHHITVQRGDTLWALAEQQLGDPHRWPELFAANRDMIANPDEIDIGWQLAVPQPPGTPIAAPEEAEVSQPPSEPPPEDGADAAPPSDVPAAPTSPATTPSVVPHPVPPSHNGAVVTPMATPGPSETESETSLDLLGPVGGVLAASLVAGVAARRQLQLLQREVGRRISTLAPPLQRFFTALVQRSRTGSGEPPGLPPTSVIIGWDDSEDVQIDLEEERCTLIDGTDEHTAGMAATMLTSLLCADWSATVEVVVVQPQEDWASALDDPRLSRRSSIDAALADLQRLCAHRRLQLGSSDLVTERADEDRAGAWEPVVFVFCQPLQPSHLDRIRDCLSLGQVGVSVVATTPPGVMHDSMTVLTIESDSRARLTGGTAVFQPQLLNQPARHAVITLFASAADAHTEPAPWWREADPAEVTELPNTAEDPVKDDAMPVWSPPPDQPTLLLLGPVDLTNTGGTRPTRAVGQCMEYCAWLLLNPGATPTTMLRELLVAEGTRRSNMSRLRTWLGDDPAGNPYLPDAYSGRIVLASSVTSDWERFQALLAGGVNRSSTPLLKQALSLVRGRPLDGVAFQWPWASLLITDMLSMITDAAAVLADRCLAERDFDGALWAIGRGQLAVGDDETLAVRRIQLLALTGARPEVDAAVTHLTRAARAENRDLTADSIRRIQHALHLSMSGVSGS